MKRSDQVATAMAWERTSRIFVLGLLFLSALQFLTGAIVYGTLGQAETDKLVFAGCVLFTALAVGVGVAFRKSGAPTWKHKLAVASVALPAALSLLPR
jgi:uncharacterized PurR-regulated membrane protein YhhQ (DUF165 family)